MNCVEFVSRPYQHARTYSWRADLILTVAQGTTSCWKMTVLLSRYEAERSKIASVGLTVRYGMGSGHAGCMYGSASDGREV